MTECKICKSKEDLLSSVPFCAFCLNDILDKWLDKKKSTVKRKPKAPYSERGRKPIWSDETDRFDDKKDIKRRGAYPLYDGVAR